MRNLCVWFTICIFNLGNNSVWKIGKILTLHYIILFHESLSMNEKRMTTSTIIFSILLNQIKPFYNVQDEKCTWFKSVNRWFMRVSGMLPKSLNHVFNGALHDRNGVTTAVNLNIVTWFSDFMQFVFRSANKSIFHPCCYFNKILFEYKTFPNPLRINFIRYESFNWFDFSCQRLEDTIFCISVFLNSRPRTGTVSSDFFVGPKENKQ